MKKKTTTTDGKRPLTDEERALAKQLLAEYRHKFTHEERVENGRKGGAANKGVSTPARKKAGKARGTELKARGHYERLAQIGLEKGWQAKGGKIGGHKGGASRSAAKIAAARANLKKANEAKKKAQAPTPFVPDI